MYSRVLVLYMYSNWPASAYPDLAELRSRELKMAAWHARILVSEDGREGARRFPGFQTNPSLPTRKGKRVELSVSLQGGRRCCCCPQNTLKGEPASLWIKRAAVLRRPRHKLGRSRCVRCRCCSTRVQLRQRRCGGCALMARTKHCYDRWVASFRLAPHLRQCFLCPLANNVLRNSLDTFNAQRVVSSVDPCCTLLTPSPHSTAVLPAGSS